MERQDYSHEVNHTNSHSLRIILVILGTLFVIIGVIGIFLPILPTTPFMLLAAACYAKSSSRFYNWLMNNKIFGPIIREWRQYRAIPKRAKIMAMFLLVITFGSSILFFVPILWVKILLACMCLSMLYFMWRIPVREITAKEREAFNVDSVDNKKSNADL